MGEKTAVALSRVQSGKFKRDDLNQRLFWESENQKKGSSGGKKVVKGGGNYLHPGHSEKKVGGGRRGRGTREVWKHVNSLPAGHSNPECCL